MVTASSVNVIWSPIFNSVVNLVLNPVNAVALFAIDTVPDGLQTYGSISEFNAAIKAQKQADINILSIQIIFNLLNKFLKTKK